MKATAIIGSMYGDESKGKHVDYHSAKHSDKTLVVRFNGGAQAGHTVVTPEGQRHVFHHFGSGVFNGCPTFLSEKFIVNPIMFRKEFEELQALGITPEVYVDEMCKLTIPHDMMLNQLVESVREKTSGRHGSVGMGIYETKTRSQHTKSCCVLYANDLNTPSFVKESIYNICHTYVPMRLSQLKLDTIPSEWCSRLMDKNIIDRYIEDVEFMCANVNIVKSIHHSFGKKFEHIVFEGAQGLMLDQHNWNFPHVTPSSTGLTNIVPLIPKFGISEMEVVYLTRAYTTRHGAGNLPYEHASPCLNVVDETNITNEWQGQIRYSYLNLDDMNRAILSDKNGYSFKIPVTYGLCVSCIDQLKDIFCYHKYGNLYQESSTDVISVLNDESVVPVTHVSDGPCRTNIKEI